MGVSKTQKERMWRGGKQETGRVKVKEREEKRKRDKVMKELGQRGREVNINR
jgi:hypothetical protein